MNLNKYSNPTTLLRLNIEMKMKGADPITAGYYNSLKAYNNANPQSMIGNAYQKNMKHI